MSSRYTHNPDPLARVKLAVAALQAGEAVILVDDEDRENEGDIVVAAEFIKAEHITFMANHARGLVCLAMTNEQVDQLGLSMMAQNNQSAYETAFTVSIEAREGVTTGISSADRARTIQVAIQRDAARADIVTPGHVFPLRARPGGVLERVGQTEGSVDLAKLAGLNPSAVICEIIKSDGTMARMPDLEEFASEHSLLIVSVADLIKYRMRTESLVTNSGEGVILVDGVGEFNTKLFKSHDGALHQALWCGKLDGTATFTRVQSAPPPWAVFDNGANAQARTALSALRQIKEAGRGVLVLMHLKGGGDIGLQVSFDVDFSGRSKSIRVPHADALRNLGTGCQILRELGLQELHLLTNSTREVVGIEAYGLTITSRSPLS